MHAYLLSLEEAVHMEVKHAGRAIVKVSKSRVKLIFPAIYVTKLLNPEQIF